jgi:hypothetical protein
MQDIEPFPVPLYVLALARPAFANDCDDAMRCRLAASRARPFSLSGCSALGCAFVCTFAASVVPATICIDSADELAMMLCEISEDGAICTRRPLVGMDVGQDSQVYSSLRERRDTDL